MFDRISGETKDSERVWGGSKMALNVLNKTLEIRAGEKGGRGRTVNLYL